MYYTYTLQCTIYNYSYIVTNCHIREQLHKTKKINCECKTFYYIQLCVAVFQYKL